MGFFFLCRFSSLSAGPILGHGCRDGERWITRTRAVLERRIENKDHGTQVHILNLDMSAFVHSRSRLVCFATPVLVTVVTVGTCRPHITPVASAH